MRAGAQLRGVSADAAERGPEGAVKAARAAISLRHASLGSNRGFLDVSSSSSSSSKGGVRSGLRVGDSSSRLDGR
eukprot:161656-Chlamydomonas_euryale.AAC.6